MMNQIKLVTLCVGAALFAPVLLVPVRAQVQWTATSSPVQSTIAGGPWTLDQGQSTTGGASGPFDGPVTYCSGGVQIINPASTVTTFHPYYFPLVQGRGQQARGLFDYRPKNVDEAIVAAYTMDAGQTWHFEDMAEQLTTECPASDTNSGGNDDGEGHPAIISFGGITWLYTLDRRSGHVDSDGLIVHNLTAKSGAPLNPLPFNSTFMIPPTANVIAGWNFNKVTGTQLTPAASTNNSAGTPSASALGMTNSYTYSTTPPTIGSVNGSNVTKTTLSSDPTGTSSVTSDRTTMKPGVLLARAGRRVLTAPATAGISPRLRVLKARNSW